MRSSDQLTSNFASIKVNSLLSRVDSKSLHQTFRRKSDGRARFQFCHDITFNGEHACIANTEEKKEKSYHDQCHNRNRDIREMFSGSKKSKKAQPANGNIIVLDW